MEHKEILAIIGAVAAVVIIISAAKNLNGQGDSSSVPEVTTVSRVTSVTRTTSYWDKIRDEQTTAETVPTQPTSDQGESQPTVSQTSQTTPDPDYTMLTEYHTASGVVTQTSPGTVYTTAVTETESPSTYTFIIRT